MEDFDLFDMLNIGFDPPETNARQVKKKIEQKKSELGSALCSESQENRASVQAQIDYLNDVEAKILSSDGKKLIDSALQVLADKKTDAELSAFSATVKLLALTGGHTVTEASIQHYKKESRLSLEHVKKVFTDAGFEIIDKDPLAAYPKFPTNADRIYSNLAALRKTKDPNPNGADTSVITDLYAFAAYISDNTKNIASYRKENTKELWKIFNRESQKYSQRNDDFGKLCGSLSTAAKVYVFNSDENRSAYENHLVYHSEKLTKLFATMKKVPEATLLSSKFADSCIKAICNYFPEYEVALAIYNKEAGFIDTYYCPTVWVYTIKCSYCGAISEFESETDAKRINMCQNCKHTLFKKCAKCGELVPAQTEKCPYPNCGYVFVSAEQFSKLYQQAEAELRRSNFESARKYLYDAQSANPGEERRINQLAARIAEKEKKYAQPINRLHGLIAGKRFSAAEKALYETIRQYPELDVTTYETQIRNALSQAHARFEALKRSPSERRADECIELLCEYVDYPLALSYMHTHPPLPCKTLSVTTDTRNGRITVNWANSIESGVTYRLEKSVGNVDNRGGGETIQDQTTETSYKDLEVKPGLAYTYTVYAVRYGVSSTPISKTVSLYADVGNFHVVQNRNCIRLTWDAPENSVGATIMKIAAGKNTVLSQAAYGSFEDKDIQYGVAYTYRIQANYSNSAYSPGVERVITPLLIIGSFKIRVAQVKDNVFKVSWDIKQPGVDLRILANKESVLECKSDSKQIQIQLPVQTFNTVSVAAYSGGTWVSSDNTIEVNTYTSCNIDKNRTELREENISSPHGIWCNLEIKIRMLEPIPGSVQGFYYAVRTVSDTSRWAAINEIGRATDIQRLSIESYNIKGEIVYTEAVKNETSFYISVFTIYAVGEKEIVSEPKSLRINRPVFADLFWEVTKGFWGGMKLSIEVSGNRPLDRIPELVLCACFEDEFITSHKDARAIVMKQIPSLELEPPQKQFSKVYDIECSYSRKDVKRLKFFLFEIDPVRSEKFALRWQQGFMGKI